MADFVALNKALQWINRLIDVLHRRFSSSSLLSCFNWHSMSPSSLFFHFHCFAMEFNISCVRRQNLSYSRRNKYDNQTSRCIDVERASFSFVYIFLTLSSLAFTQTFARELGMNFSHANYKRKNISMLHLLSADYINDCDKMTILSFKIRLQTLHLRASLLIFFTHLVSY